MLDLQAMGKMTEKEREEAIQNHAQETVEEVYKPRKSIGGMMVRKMIEAVERGER